MAFGGRGEIRTHERLATLPVFKTGALNHSATLPATASQALGVGTDKNKLRIGPKFSSFGMLGWAVYDVTHRRTKRRLDPFPGLLKEK